MLINLFGGLYGPEVIAAFSGALLFTMVQHTFRGLHRLLVFLVSFLMGVVGANATLSLVSPWLPADVTFGNETGAFICSALIVNVAMLAIGRVEKLMASGH
ncbi:putative holin [Erwinia persicina]|uniref:Uncharacterized protein n=1 Tax=Erwinia persicina TaxID=55211 RepID=A0A4U3EQS4_9GAMM|nr:putative holin [Erwinia persicina]MBD8109100.1 hypothetical protein [Erwinia persicina]MBD8170199.1 hypothetical protein [Erwinia persicina]MBD8212224.1 hypothetical protein [Erwinia persicina]TKJ82675.1 hypothetical protein EpCFBP13511_23765 [Erwinia persicina]